jgi:hypothetical protein
VKEWKERMITTRDRGEPVIACHDKEVARVAKNNGFRDVFYAKKSDTNGLTKTMLTAIEFWKTERTLGSKK